MLQLEILGWCSSAHRKEVPMCVASGVRKHIELVLLHLCWENSADSKIDQLCMQKSANPCIYMIV